MIGLLTALGLVSAYAEVGAGGFVVTFVFVEVSVGWLGWLLLNQAGKPGLPAVVELGPAFTAGALTVAGLCWSFSWWAMAMLTFAVVTAPYVKTSARREAIRDYGSDLHEMRQQFEEIVAHGFADPGTASPGAAEAA